MAIFQGSMNYTYSGRKRKTVRSTSKRIVSKGLYTAPQTYRRDVPNYPSKEDVGFAVVKDSSYKKEISSKYTIAPAYNKGAYQVISRENVEDIGR